MYRPCCGTFGLSTILAILDLMSSSAGNEKATTAHAHNDTLKCDTCDRFRASNKIGHVAHIWSIYGVQVKCQGGECHRIFAFQEAMCHTSQVE